MLRVPVYLRLGRGTLRLAIGSFVGETGKLRDIDGALAGCGKAQATTISPPWTLQWSCLKVHLQRP